MTSENNLAIIYSRTGRVAEAEKLYKEDYEVSRKLLGDEHPDLLAAISNLGRIYIAEKKYDEAERILAKGVATANKVVPRDFYGRGMILLSYGETLVATHRTREAEPYLVEAYAVLRPIKGADDPGVGFCVKTLTGFYEQTGRPAEAAKWRSRITPAK
jgi:tetratricopeptide (TPR) repeat protein